MEGKNPDHPNHFIEVNVVHLSAVEREVVNAVLIDDKVPQITSVKDEIVKQVSHEKIDEVHENNEHYIGTKLILER